MEELVLVLGQILHNVLAAGNGLILTIDDNIHLVDVLLAGGLVVGLGGDEQVITEGRSVSSALDVHAVHETVGAHSVVDLSGESGILGQVAAGVAGVGVRISLGAFTAADQELGVVVDVQLADLGVGDQGSVGINGDVLVIVNKVIANEIDVAVLVVVDLVESHALETLVVLAVGRNVSILIIAIKANLGIGVAQIDFPAGALLIECAVQAVGAGKTIHAVDSHGLFLAIHEDEGSLGVAGLTDDPNDVLEDSVVAVVDRSVTDQVAELVEEPGELSGLGGASRIKVEANGIIVILVVDGVLGSVVPVLGLSALEGLGLANNLNVLHSAFADDLIGSLLVDVDQNVIVLGIVVAGNVDGLVLVSGLVAGELHVVVANNVTLGVELLSNNVSNLGEVGVDDDQTIAAVNLVVLELLALSTDHGLSGGSGVGDIGGFKLAVGVGVNNSGGLLHTESLADVALGSLNVEGSLRGSGDLSIGVLGAVIILEVLVAVLEPHGGGTAPNILAVVGSELEVLVTNGGLLQISNLIGDIAESRSVGDHILLDGLEQQLGDELTGSRSAEVGGLVDVVEDAEGLSILGDVQSPVSTGELVVLVITDNTQDHGEDFIAGHVAGGLEGAIGITLDVFSVGSVADVARGPAGAGHVAELVVGGIQAGLILAVTGSVRRSNTIDDRGHLSAGDVVLGQEGTVHALENTHAIENGSGLSVIGADVLVILEGTGADSQRQSHDQSQHHCE